MSRSNVSFELNNPVHFLALGFGAGLLKPAPGTWGTLAAVPIYLVLNLWMPMSHWLSGLSLGVIGFVLGIYLCGRTAKDVGVHDHSAIVWDEFVGFWVSMWLLPVTWATVLLAFVLFRLFDILKPWPIRWLDQHVHGGFGIMVDDLLAGLMACGLLHLGISWGIL